MTEIRIHTYTAAAEGLLVNSYLLETADGVVLVDANLLVSDARALAARVAALHKPLVAAFVTHAHPDHFNGLPYVVGDDVPVYATKAVADTVAVIAGPKRDQWQPVFGGEWPDRYRAPDHLVADGAVVAVAGLRVRVHDLGAGESHADSYLVVDDMAFIGGPRVRRDALVPRRRAQRGVAAYARPADRGAARSAAVPGPRRSGRCRVARRTAALSAGVPRCRTPAGERSTDPGYSPG
jgi:glyoxylase-like metal-dependent hydrolase (beta-lactamase superfamily II)